MNVTKKTKKRGFVMTGGGAKGLYEAGVINAFHLAGMEFDVITGSSIGAMNSVFFAEYLYHKRNLDEQVRQDPEQVIKELDPLIKAYHHAWLMMPDKRVIDDSPEGPLGKLKDDLLHFNLSLPQVTRLAWWWTDPQRKELPDPALWPTLLKLGKELAERLGGIGQVLRIIKYHRQAPLQEAVRTYLERFKMEHSLIPSSEDHKLKDIFSQPVSPLRAEHLQAGSSAPDEAGVQKYALVDPTRTLRDYAEKGIQVRLTRANYRTGRLEISAYIPESDFVRFMEKQAWRLQKEGPEKVPLGSFRLQIPGNPIAINAALCSGRFPGVFTPYPIAVLYPQSDPDNVLLHRLLSGWLYDPQVVDGLTQAYFANQSRTEKAVQHWDALLDSWRDSQSMQDFFPKATDAYVDGGAIDNTPSNSAVDFVREWAEQPDRSKPDVSLSKRDVILDLFVIFLGVEPKIGEEEAQDPNLYQVVKRTLGIVGVAKESSDANTVSTINNFGKRGEELGQALKLVLESYQENLGSLDAARQRQIEEQLLENARLSGQRGYLTGGSEGILERMAQWAEEQVAKRLPLHVEEVKIYPEEMPLDTLQFTERFGYRQKNALKMLTMGCYNTMWALREHLEEQNTDDLDERDQQVLRLTQKWMGVQDWPETAGERESMHRGWRCQRITCVFHEKHCPHGLTGPDSK